MNKPDLVLSNQSEEVHRSMRGKGTNSQSQSRRDRVSDGSEF